MRMENEKRMMTGAIFDVDGVLLDSMNVWGEIDAQYLIRQGKTPDADLSKVLFAMHMTESVEYLRNKYELPGSCEEILGQIVEMMEEYYTHIIQPKEGTVELLKALKEREIPVTVATAGDRGLARAGLESGGLMPYIDAVFPCEDVGRGKESPAVYLAALESMGTDLASTWVFEDSLHGILTAGRAGFPTVGVYDQASEGNHGRIKENCTYYLEDFGAWEDFLKEATKWQG